MTETEGRAQPPPARVRVAQGLAFVALVASAVGALGPAEQVRTTYSWPPSALPAESPDSVWYAPLLLSRHRPESISATLPCTLPDALPGAESPATVLATARNPDRVDGLAIARVGRALEISVGTDRLDRVELADETLDGGECAYRLDVRGAQWSLQGGPEGVERGGTLDIPPVVNGFFSALDLRSPGAPSVAVTTAVHTTRTTTRQAVAWTLAALAAVAALLLVSLGGPGLRVRERLRGLRRRLLAADGVVAAVLLGWWVISPAYIDDGWTIAREAMFDESRGFSYYYSAFGANLPLDYWLDWAQHWLVEASSSLLWLRLPALVCMAVVWMLSRVVAARILGDALRGAPAWALASVFLIGAMAWGMTLRPEPVTAVFVTAVALCMLLFLERKTTAAVAATGALVALALSAHPAGIVSLAAVIVAAPALVRWLRPNLPAATAIVAASLALLGLLLFVGADLEQRRDDAQLTRTYAFAESWRDEVTRYRFLAEHHYGTPLRRASVALIGLALLALLLRRRRGRRELLDFPSLVLAAGMVLLFLTPSKWPSHFGTRLGVAAIAAACETARIREAGLRATRWEAWPLLALVGVTAAVSWAWLEREHWNVVDLRSLDWTPGLESWLPVARLAVVLPLLVLVGGLLFSRPRHGVPWRVAAWAAPLVALPLILFTAGVVVADAAKTDGWTLTRQNLDSLAGRDPGCGLGEDLLVPRIDSARPIAARGRATLALPSWVPLSPAAGVPRYGLGPTGEPRVSSPWFELPADERIGLFVAGAAGPSNRLLVEWGRARGSRVETLSSEPLAAGLGPMSGTSPWRFFADSDLPARDPEADSVRLVHAVDVEPGPAVAVTAPVTYDAEPLAARLTERSTRTLVMPNVLTYFPCASLPVLRDGAVEVPTTVVSWENPFSPIQFPLTSPFVGLPDLYRLAPLSFSDSEKPPSGVYVYEVDREIPGAAIAVPDATTTS